MSFAEFLQSASGGGPLPSKIRSALAALWCDRHGDWHGAHELAQANGDKNSAWVHAYLHRKEGDETNAGYWYRLAGRAASRSPLDEEWTQIVQALLKDENR
jgi:hypothetical protein